MVTLSLDWTGDLNFQNSPGNPSIDLRSGVPAIATPPQALAYAVMACMAMDVVHIVQKSRQELRGLSVKFEGERAAEHPRRWISMHILFEITGNVEPHVVERAIELSKTTYCSVWNTLRSDIDLKATYTIKAV